MILSEDVLSLLIHAKHFLEKYLSTARLDVPEQERAEFLLDPDFLREAFSDGGSPATLIERVKKYGSLAVFESGVARKEDFKRNQGQGEWAEQLLLNCGWPGYKLVPFGPSDGVVPDEHGYESHRLLYRELTVLEGKRPDLLLFPDSISPEDLVQLSAWPTRALRRKDRQLMEKCICGIEMKSSLKHYKLWREKSKKPLSITMKEEELADIEFWISKFSKPILFVQSFVDELYIASYSGMKNRMKRGNCNIRTEPLTGKKTCMFPISSSEPLLAEVNSDFSLFKIDLKGNVKRPRIWPKANITLHEADISDLLQS